MACLAGRVELRVLQTATALPAAEVEQRLAPALDDGLLVLEPGPEDAVRFRHDRVQESILRRLGSRRAGALRLRLARRLGKRPEFFAVAAEQYLPMADAVRDPDERSRVAELLGRAADQAKLLSNYPLVERLLAAAVSSPTPRTRRRSCGCIPDATSRSTVSAGWTRRTRSTTRSTGCPPTRWSARRRRWSR